MAESLFAQSPTVFHITHWKAASQWVYQVLEASAPQRIVIPLPENRQFLHQPILPGMVYPTIYVTREEFESVDVPPHHVKFFVMRDLRDSLVSWYFSRRYSHREMFVASDRRRDQLNERSIEDGLRLGMHTFGANIARIQTSWIEAEILILRYEDMIADELGHYRRILQECRFGMDDRQIQTIVRTYSFENKSGGRSKGSENIQSHLRKGMSGDWVNYLKGDLLVEFKELYDEVLIATGYEKDRDWGLANLPRIHNVPEAVEVIRQRHGSADQPVCWCGHRIFEPFSTDYQWCKNCGTLVYQHPVTLEDIQQTDFYGQSYWMSSHNQAYLGGSLEELAQHHLSHTEYLDHLKTILKYKSPGAKVLDLGCGAGAFAALLKYAGFDVVGLEVSQWLASRVAEDWGVPVFSGFIENRDFAPASFDAIVLINVLEHLPDPVGTLQACWQLLKPDGLLFLKPRLFRRTDKSHDELLHEGSKTLRLLRPVEHIYLFTRPAFERFLTHIGSTWSAHEERSLTVCGKGAVETIPEDERYKMLSATSDSRMVLALLDLHKQLARAIRRREEDQETAYQQLERALRVSQSERGPIQTDQITIGGGWYPRETYEGETFCWVYNNAEVIIHTPSGQFDTLMIELEPGPSMGGAFVLSVLDEQHEVVTWVEVTHRQTVTVQLLIASGEKAVFFLHVDGGGNRIPNDPRILNFRVFKLGWAAPS
jgi:lipopolysaccharide transport system ATP-binding protein